MTSRLAPLDGLRGCAILMVLGWHYVGLPLGWMGVDVFFVLSGFLITRVLLRSRDSQNYYVSFYTRRAFRILPAYLLLIGGFAYLVWRGGPPISSRAICLSGFISLFQHRAVND
jgi:peptidoglycan/LPS O-acetylase OafA/YrhL